MKCFLQGMLLGLVALLVFTTSIQAQAAYYHSHQPSLSHQVVSYKVQVGKRKRTYSVYVPGAAQVGHPLPVLVVLHGAYGSGEKIMSYTQMNAFAEKKGFLAVYPDKDGLLDWDLAGGNHSRDIAFIRSLLEELEQAYPIDQHRIYATGYSSGGELAEILACSMPDKLAAIAPVEANMRKLYISDCQVNKPIPVLMINGTSDPIDPFQGDGKELISIPDSIKFWEDHNGCEPGAAKLNSLPSQRADDPTRVHIFENNQCQQNATVTLVKIDLGGHTWAGTPMRPSIPPPPFGFILGRTSHNIDANETIWNFCEQHTL